MCSVWEKMDFYDKDDLYRQLDQLEEEFNVVLRKDTVSSVRGSNSNSSSSQYMVLSDYGLNTRKDLEDYWAWLV